MSHPGDRLSAYLDGELSPEEGGRVREHLRGCQACREELAAVQEARGMLRSLPLLTPPPLIIENRGSPRRPGRLKTALTAAAAVVLLAAVGLVARPAPEDAAGPLDLDTVGHRHVARSILDLGPMPVRVAQAVDE